MGISSLQSNACLAVTRCSSLSFPHILPGIQGGTIKKFKAWEFHLSGPMLGCDLFAEVFFCQILREWRNICANYPYGVCHDQRLYECQINRLNLIDARLCTTESFSTLTCARRRSYTTHNTGCVKILYKCEISKFNPHRQTFQRHWVFLDSDVCA